MSEITTVTLNQLNALTRGNESAASAAARTSVNVSVTQVSGNTITLSNTQNKQSVQLPSALLSNLGNVKPGQTFELVSVPNKPNTYTLFPLTAGNRTTNNSAQQTQVLASTKVSVNDNQLSAIVTKATGSGDISFNAKPIINIQGRITAISANQVSLSFSIPGTNLPSQQAQITLSKSQVDTLRVNSNVNIAIDVNAKPAKILSLSSPNIKTAGQSPAVITLNAQLSQLNSGALPDKLLSAAILQQLSTSNLPRANAANQSINQLGQVLIPLTDAKLSTLPKSLLSALQNSISALNTNGANGVSLLIENTAKPNSLKLSVLGTLNKSSAELSLAQVRAVVANTENKTTLLGESKNPANTAQNSRISPTLASDINKQGFIGSRAELLASRLGKTTPSDVLTNRSELNKPAIAQPIPTQPLATNNNAANQPDAPNFKTNLLLEQLVKYARANATSNPQTANVANASNVNNSANTSVLTQLLGQIPNTKITSVIEQLTSATVSQKTAPTFNVASLKSQVQGLLNSGSAQAASQTQTLTNIINILNEQADIEALSPEAQTLLKNVKELLPAPSNTASVDARTIQQLIGAPLNNAPINASSPLASNGFLSGLVTLLQVGLATKLQRQSNKQASKLQDQLPEVLKSLVPNIQSTQSTKLMQDFRQFDAKHTLSAEVAKMLFSHQHHKLKSIESSLQGQDQLYYALPNFFNKNADDIELLVKRETREKKNAQDNAGVSSWYLTMKLDVGEMGQILAKTQLTDDEVKLQLYTSTNELKNKALDMLPYLQKRLSGLGINLVEKSCQLGKIPKQLKSEHYQVFETQV